MLGQFGLLFSVSALSLMTAGTAHAQATEQSGTQLPGSTVESAATAPDLAPEGEEIVVTGLRQSLQSSQQIKRNAPQIVDTIVAQDIGKLPDTNISETLARITGVQVDRAAGEAGRVLIRGLPDFTTTYNGREIFTAESRRVQPQDFAAGTVSALEVYKSTTADQIEGGIAGLINVRSRRPFDFTGLEVAGVANGVLTKQSGDANFNGSLLVSNRWDTGIGEIGALVNASYVGLRYQDGRRFVSGAIQTGVPTGNGTGREATPEERSRPDAFRYPDAEGIFYLAGNRWRPSVNAALQWRPTPDLEFYGDFLWQGFRRNVEDRQIFVPLFGAGATFSNITFRDNDRREVQSLTATNQLRPDFFQGATREETNTYQYAVGGSWSGDRVKISADVARTDSKSTVSIYSLDTAFSRTPSATDVNFDVPQGVGGASFQFRDFDVADPANYVYRGFFDRLVQGEGQDYQARLDLEYKPDLTFLPSLQVGIRFNDRDGEFRNGERYTPGEDLRLPITALPVRFGAFRPGFRGSDIQPVKNWLTASYGDIRDNIASFRQLAGFPEGVPPADPLQQYSVNEKTYSGYVQANWAIDVGFPIDGTLGLRAVRTETTLNGNSIVADVLTPTTGKNEYTDFLPHANLRARLTDELQLRLSFTETRSRPGFTELNPGVSINPPGGSSFRTGRGGNPNLRPVNSKNYDASLEYYFTRTGFASVGLFRRNFDGFISPITTNVQDPFYGDLRIDRPENGGTGRLEGVEAQVRTFLDIPALPEWARGFGVEANVTYTDGDQEAPAGLGTDERIGFIDVSKWTYNLVGLYEYGGVSTRLAYNYRDDFPQGFQSAAGGAIAAAEFSDRVTRLDFSLNYTPFENITLAFDATNLFAKPFRSYRNYSENGVYPRDVRYEESTYSFGVRFRL
jgi:TonB-dependent receptor